MKKLFLNLSMIFAAALLSIASAPVLGVPVSIAAAAGGGDLQVLAQYDEVKSAIEAGANIMSRGDMTGEYPIHYTHSVTDRGFA